jgi:hypothetical protein
MFHFVYDVWRSEPCTIWAVYALPGPRAGFPEQVFAVAAIHDSSVQEGRNAEEIGD